jgi:Leucine-rich repeat (LRR) protein/energy-coupling factor transporter ATP-binding protein EcfA2
MNDDLGRLKQLEKKLGIKLEEQNSLEEIIYLRGKGYRLNNKDKVIGLSLDGSGLNAVPEVIFGFTDLKYLKLSCNKIINLPKQISNLTNLIILNMNENRLVVLPESLGKLEVLKKLELSHNELTDLPGSFRYLSGLTKLNLSHNKFCIVPEVLWQLPLRIVWSLPTFDGDINLWGNPMTDDECFRQFKKTWFASAVFRDKKLIELNLEPCGLIEFVIIDEYKDLEKLSFRNNHLTSLPEAIGDLTKLTSLDLACNELTSLPETMSNLISLTYLSLGYNKLSALPEWLGDLTNLTKLNLCNNRLTTLPESLGGLTKITELDVSLNMLTTLPESLGNLTSLTNLNLRYNNLKTLPMELFDLPLKMVFEKEKASDNVIDLHGNPLFMGTLKKVEIRNIKCFRDISLSLNPSLNLILGCNGSGKTTLLQALALVLIGLKKSPDNWPVGCEGEIRLFFCHKDRTVPVSFEIKEGSACCVEGARVMEVIRSHNLFLAYNISSMTEYAIVPTGFYSERKSVFDKIKSIVNGLFREIDPLTPPELLSCDKDNFYFSIHLSGSNLRLSNIPLKALSDGERYLFKILLDLVIRAFEKNPDLGQVTGIVLIDKIDLLLFLPSWKRTIVNSLHKVFPKLQFIFTSQNSSFYIIQSMPGDALFSILKRDNGNIKVSSLNLEGEPCGYGILDIVDWALDNGIVPDLSDWLTESLLLFERAVAERDKEAVNLLYNQIKEIIHPGSSFHSFLETMGASLLEEKNEHFIT